MAAAAAAGIFSGIAGSALGTIGSGLNYKSQKDTNKLNYQMFKESQAFNKQMQEDQFAFSEDMYNKSVEDARETWMQQAEYNSPVNQKKRLEEAGYNVQLLGSGISTTSGASATGTSGTTSSGSGGSGVNAPQLQAPRLDLSSAGSMILAGLSAYNEAKNSETNRQLTDEQINQLQIENSVRYRRQMTELANIIADTKNKEARTKTINALRQLEVSEKRANISRNLQETENLKAAWKGIVAQSTIDVLAAENLPQQLSLGISEQMARIANYAAMTKLTKQQTRTEVFKSLKTQYEAAGQKISNRQLERTSDLLVENMQKQNEYLGKQIGGYIPEREKEIWSTGRSFLSAVGSVIGATALIRNAGKIIPQTIGERAKSKVGYPYN